MGAPRGKGQKHGASQKPSTGNFFGGGGYASHGAYMVEKNRKLKEQLAVTAVGEGSERSEKPPIFKGLSFWMTGRTCVPDQELKRLIVEHGGIYEQYGFTRVSHIIADNLATGNQTWRELRNRVKRGNVVTSSWIIACTEAQRRIPEVRYMPECLSSGSGMLSFIGSTAPKASTASLNPHAGEDSTSAEGKGVKRLQPCSDDLPNEIIGQQGQQEMPTIGSSSREEGDTKCGSASERTFSLMAMADVFTKKFSTASGKHLLRERTPIADSSQRLQMHSIEGGSSCSSSSSTNVVPKVERQTKADGIPKTIEMKGASVEGGSSSSSCFGVFPNGEKQTTIDDLSETATVKNNHVSRNASCVPISLEASASCSVGVSGLAEILSVLQDLSMTAVKSLRFHKGSGIAAVGLRIAVEPIEEWSRFHDLVTPLVLGDEFHDASHFKSIGCQHKEEDELTRTAASVFSELRALFESASTVFAWEEHDGWSNIRRIAIQLSLCEQSEILVSHRSPRSPLGVGIVAASLQSIQPDVAGESTRKVVKKARRSWPASLLKLQGQALQSGQSGCHFELKGVQAPRLHKRRHDMEGLCSKGGSSCAIFQPPCLLVDEAPQIEEVCATLISPKTIDVVEELSSESQAVSGESLRRNPALEMMQASHRLVGSTGVLLLVEQLRSQCCHSVHAPGAARSLLQLATRALVGTGFQEYSAALLTLLRWRELDVVNVALRTLRAVAIRGLTTPEPVRIPVASCFNALIHDLNRSLDVTMHGARIDILPLPEVQSGEVA